MTYHHSGEVDPFLLEDALLMESPWFGWCRGMRRDRDTRGPVSLGHLPKDALDARGDTRAIGGAFQDAGAHARVGNALTNLSNEYLDHRLGPTHDGAWAAKVKEHRHVVVGVDAGCHDDVDFGHHIGDRLDPRYVAAQSDDSQVDQRVDAFALELSQFGDGTGSLGRLVPLLGRLLDVGAEHDDVLVHQGGPQSRPVNRPLDGVDLGHRTPSRPRGKNRGGAGERSGAGLASPSCSLARLSQEGHSGSCGGAETEMFGWRRSPQRRSLSMPRPSEPPSPESRARTNVRLRRLTRCAVIAATGASALVGVVVAKEVPGGSSNTSSTNGTPAAVTPTTSGTSATSTTSRSSSTASAKGSNTTNAPTTTTTVPTVTSGGTSR